MPTRAGAAALSLLAAPLNARLLQALACGRRSLGDLRREAGSPAPTTLRSYLRELTDAGIVEGHRRDAFPGSLEYALTESGRELLAVAGLLRDWLNTCGDGPTPFGGDDAKASVKALVDAWTSGMVRALAVRPLSLTELNRVIPTLSYPALERRIAAGRLAGLLEPVKSTTQGTPYAITDWLRMGIRPLIAAAHWERRSLRRPSAVTERDVEAAFMLALPALCLGREVAGSCLLAVRIGSGSAAGEAGVIARFEGGEVVTCSSRLTEDTDGWIVGTAATWFAAIEGSAWGRLDTGGAGAVAGVVLAGLRRSLARQPLASAGPTSHGPAHAQL